MDAEKNKKEVKVKLRFFDSYIATIKKSVGAQVFQTLWADVDGEKMDVLQNGEKSCAIFVSSILQWFDLIERRHATVSGTLKDMRQKGWQEISEPRVGCVLHWEKVKTNGEENEHIGFYMGDTVAVSTSRTARTPIEHHWTYGENNDEPERKVIGIYWHSKLEEKYWNKD